MISYHRCLVTLLIFVCGTGLQLKASQVDYTLFDPLVDAIDLIQKHYVKEIDSDKLVAGAINGILHELDMHSEFIPAIDVDNYQKMTTGSYEGIGVGIENRDGQLKIISPFEGSPADKAGIRAGDVILQIDGKDTNNISDTQAVKELTGPANTEVILKVLREDNTEEEIKIKRQKISLPSVTGWRRNSVDNQWDYILDDEKKIAYVRLSQFTENSAQEFTDAIDHCLAKNCQAIILDLRRNPGGLMSSAVEIVDSLIDEGVIVSTRGAHSMAKAERATSSSTYPKFHMAVLINQASASAAEIVAGALQDHNRAVIIGERSWGKGSVQRLFKLQDSGAAVKMTTDYYYLPKGRCVHKLPNADEWGVEPDIKETMDSKHYGKLSVLFSQLTSNSDRTVSGNLDELWQEDAKIKSEQLEKLLELDNQFSQAYKQCKGFIRTRPALESLSKTIQETN